MALVSDGSGTEVCSIPFGLEASSARPLTMFCWLYMPVPGASGAHCLYLTLGSQHYKQTMIGIESWYQYGLVYEDSTSSGVGPLKWMSPTGSLNVPIGSWFAGALTTTSLSDRTIWMMVNGDIVGTTLDSTVISSGTWDAIQVLATDENSGTITPGCMVAEVAVWVGHAFGVPEMRQLAQGVNPLAIHGPKPTHYWPLRGDLRDLGTQPTWLQNTAGTKQTWGPHAPAMPPPRRRGPFRPSTGGPATHRRPFITLNA